MNFGPSGTRVLQLRGEDDSSVLQEKGWRVEGLVEGWKRVLF